MNDKERKERILLAEKWAEHVYHIPKEIEKYKDGIKMLVEMRDGLKSPTLDDDHVASSGATNGDERIFSLIFNTQEEIEKTERVINQLMHERQLFLVSCMNIESPLFEILSHRYIRREPWEQIAERIGYSQDHARGSLKKRAMLALFDVMPAVEELNTP